MTWAIPNWYAALLLALAAYRVWRLFALDTILDPVRRGLASGSRREEFLTCPFCLGSWIALASWVAWVAWPHGTLVAAAPFAIMAVVGLVGSRLDPG